MLTGKKDGIFQQDNAPCHVSKAAKDHLRRRGINLLDWPPSSPDINPIENWAIVKCRVKSRVPIDKRELIAKLIDVWHHDGELSELCKRLVESMPARVAAVIAEKGAQTRF